MLRSQFNGVLVCACRWNKPRGSSPSSSRLLRQANANSMEGTQVRAIDLIGHPVYLLAREINNQSEKRWPKQTGRANSLSSFVGWRYNSSFCCQKAKVSLHMRKGHNLSSHQPVHPSVNLTLDLRETRHTMHHAPGRSRGRG